VYHPPLIEPGTELVTLVETDRFRIRPMTVHDAIRDYEAVATSPKELGAAFGDPDAVPMPYTMEQEIIELGWHQKEFQMGFSFTFIVVPLDEHTSYGNVYVFPATRGDFDAEVYTWVRKEELGTGLGEELFDVARRWIERDWPFERVAYPGRDIDWPTWEAMKSAVSVTA
jgi:RimJ/RimL family protein N-acetyltransferase